jgi:hypothetical protein
MVILKTKKVEFIEPIAGEDYIIVLAETTTIKDKWEQVKVALEPIDRKKNDLNIYNAGLWMDETFTEKSKLGAFITAFEEYYKANNIDTNPQEIESWEGAIFRTLTWETRNNNIQIRGYHDEEAVKTLQEELETRRKRD